ncbi:MAG TPA: trypsin-like peptidase domain-containing protein [Flavobacteriaceae bacterium]|nr:trypsin-like peptidase domain-containing protein [Flavobacteriaceae bacterium]
MKKHLSLFLVALFSGILTLSGYKFFIEKKNELPVVSPTITSPALSNANYNPTHFIAGTNIDFTYAAEKTVNAVVHVKNRSSYSQPLTIFDFFYGNGNSQREVIGFGSGVIISPDGYIVTNNHVIEHANQLEVVLNNNMSYTAELVGSDPKTDIALLKINSDEDLPYIAFADSDNIKVGEWVLAVGNPFNLTSTVTAGIVSAKARNLNEFDGNPQSFIQTDAAVNRGNSGGALVNVNGELVGINTAITSQTGSYVGYSFAVPSNVTRKVVEDILEYGNVQRAIMGVQIVNLSAVEAENLGIRNTQGVYVAGVEIGSGADLGGIKKGDVITKMGQTIITKYADLVAYLNAKRPHETVEVTIERNGKEMVLPVTLIKLETYQIESLGLEVKNMNASELKARGVANGVKITRALTREMAQYDLTDIIITAINDQKVKNIDDVKRIMDSRQLKPIKVDVVDTDNKTNTYFFR